MPASCPLLFLRPLVPKWSFNLSVPRKYTSGTSQPLGLKVTLSTCFLTAQAFLMVGKLGLEWGGPALKQPGAPSGFWVPEQRLSEVRPADSSPYSKNETLKDNVCTVNQRERATRHHITQRPQEWPMSFQQRSIEHLLLQMPTTHQALCCRPGGCRDGGGGSIPLAGFVDTSQSQRFSHPVVETVRQGIPKFRKTQRKHSESIWEGEWVPGRSGRGGGSRQREQTCDRLRGDMEPGTRGEGGTEEVARGWATGSQLGETDIKVPTLQVVCQGVYPDLLSPAPLASIPQSAPAWHRAEWELCIYMISKAFGRRDPPISGAVQNT